MMSSNDYAELAGLEIYLSRLNCIKEEYHDEEYCCVKKWVIKRIEELKSSSYSNSI